jgi:ribosomal protein S27E
VNNSQAQHIAAQALKALHLRRQLERGDLTQQEYLDGLKALQETPVPAAAQLPRATAEPDRDTGRTRSRRVVSEPLPKLIGSREALQLRRCPENDQLTPEEYPAQLNAQPEMAHRAVKKPAPLQRSTPTAPPMPAAPAMVTTQATPERPLAMKCPGCAANLGIYDQTMELQCSDCGADIVIERKHCTIVLRLADEVSEDTDAIVALAASTDEELKKLRAEEAMVTIVKHATGILGGLCGVVFAYTGIVDMAARHIAVGTSILVCGSALLGIVICITQHTNKVRANLTAQIRAITDFGI